MQMPSDAAWAAMATLHRDVGLRFIIGLPLNNNNEQLMAAMIRKAWQVLPAAAIAGFELGNEPMYWEVCPDVNIGAVRCKPSRLQVTCIVARSNRAGAAHLQ
jgi:hypothetical protein